MADRRFDAKNNQKKEISIFASAELATAAALSDTLFTLPEASLVTAVYAIVTTVSGVASSTIDVAVGGTVVGDEIPVTALGVAEPGTLTKTYFPTGGSVTVAAGAVAPDAAGRMKIVVEYIETELAEGTYTD